MDKYYSLLPKRKADILRWMTGSEGPWKTPDSFACLQSIDTKMSPVKVSNEDEILFRALQSKSNMNSDCKKTSSLHVELEDTSMTFNPVDSTLSIRSSDNVNKNSSLDWPSDW